MSRGNQRDLGGTGHLFIGKPWFLVVVAASCLALSACQTCVSGLVTAGGEPVSEAYVYLIDQDWNILGGALTAADGRYCFDQAAVNQNLRVIVYFADYYPQERPILTGGSPAVCATGPCTEVETVDFACVPEDGLEPNNSCPEASLVNLPYANPLAGRCPPGDVDFYRFEVTEEDRILVAETAYPGTGREIDTFIGLLDRDCNILVTDDDGGYGLYSRLAFALPAPGTYYLAVTRFGDYTFEGRHSSVGAYGLTVKLTEASCLEVRVTEQGEPVEGAYITAQQYPWDSCLSDAAGSCCFYADTGSESRFEICHPQTWDCVEVSGVPSTPGSCEEGGCEELLFDFDYTCLSGNVTRDEEPVAGTTVCVEYWYQDRYRYHCVDSEADGAYCVHVPPETEVTVYAWDPLFYENYMVTVRTGSGGTCEEGGCTEVPFAFRGITCVSGTVTREGEPVADTYVSTWWNGTQTGPDGHYCLTAPKESEVTLYVCDPITGQCQEQTVVSGLSGSCEEGGCTEADFSLPEAACVQGVATRTGGLPAELVEVCVSSGGCTYTDAEGRYCVRTAVESDVDLYLYDPASGEWRGQQVRTGTAGSCREGPCTEVNFEDLPPVACVSGVVSRGSSPQPEVAVCVSGNPCVSTDSAGRFCLPARADSDAYLCAWDPILNQNVCAYVRTGSPGSCSEGNCATANLGFQEVSCVSGVVREGTDPLAGAQVYNNFGNALTDAEGRYCLPAPANETNCIRALHPADGSEILRYPLTGIGGSCDLGGCKIQNFTFDLRTRR